MSEAIAIETEWRGYRCRSRLEARWLVFLDAMGIAFEYEPEGFKLPGVSYLPDLFLPHLNIWAEVKPKWFTTEEENKAYALAQATGKHVLLLDSSPNFQSYFGFMQDAGRITITDFSLDVERYSQAYREGRLWAQPHYRLEDLPEQFSERYQSAVYAARSERFES